jgi:hypothetical protein
LATTFLQLKLENLTELEENIMDVEVEISQRQRCLVEENETYTYGYYKRRRYENDSWVKNKTFKIFEKCVSVAFNQKTDLRFKFS